MARKLPRNVHVDRSRHGLTRYYYRAGRGLRVRLPDSIGSEEFNDAVRLAEKSGISIPRPRIERPSFERTQRQRVGKTVVSALRAARNRAKRRGLPFDLDFVWAITTIESQDFKCSLTSIPFYMNCKANSRKAHPFSPSLDRIEPGKGYVRSNVRIVALAVNIMLLDWGTDIFERVAAGYRHTKGKKSQKSIPVPCNTVRAETEIMQ